MIHWPNILTLGRIALIPLIVTGLLAGFVWTALILYTIACFTDYLDGYLARRRNQFSDLGIVLDPIADKLLIITIVMTLIMIGRMDIMLFLPAWIIVVREILVSGLREYLAVVKIRLPVSRLSKTKTAIQMIALGFLIVGDGIVPGIAIGTVGLWLAAIMTLVSGYAYLRAGLVHIASFEERKRHNPNPTPNPAPNPAPIPPKRRRGR